MKQELALVPSKYFNCTQTALEIKNDTPIEEWLRIGELLKKANHATQWWLGDWHNFGATYGEMASQGLDAGDYDRKSLRNFSWVANKVDLSLRRDSLTFGHHEVIASLEPKLQKKWLDKASDNNWSIQELTRHLKVHNVLETSKAKGSGKVVLIEGDVLKVKLPEVDIVLTDPPYNVTENEWDKFGTTKQFMQWTEKWLRKVKWNKHLFVFCSSQYIADFEMLLRKLKLPVKSRIVWVHKNMSMGRVAQDSFITCYDMIFHCGKTDLNFPTEWSSERFDVKEFANPQTNFTDTKLHPTQKPYELIKELLKYSSKETDTVLDCFAGSGTTGVAAQELGNKCYLIEKDKEYIEIIKKRLCL